jgi:hypothetical protein
MILDKNNVVVIDSNVEMHRYNSKFIWGKRETTRFLESAPSDFPKQGDGFFVINLDSGKVETGLASEPQGLSS